MKIKNPHAHSRILKKLMTRDGQFFGTRVGGSAFTPCTGTIRSRNRPKELMAAMVRLEQSNTRKNRRRVVRCTRNLNRSPK